MSTRILIADDAPFIREILKQLLSDAGHKIVAEADTGQAVFELVQKHKPEVVIMDLVMPGLNGLQATQQILSKFPDMKIIACSTLNQEDMILKALQAGCCNYITKPFNEEQVLKAVSFNSEGALKHG